MSERGARRRALAQRALEILGEGGSHALTHRAVDAALSLPAGSCSFYYGTRLALIGAAADRLCELDRDAVVDAREDTGRFDVFKLLRSWTSARSRTLLLARLELYLLAMREPAVRERVVRNRSEFLAIAEADLSAKRVPHAARAASELLSLIDGELLRVALFGLQDGRYAPSDAFSRELSRFR